MLGDALEFLCIVLKVKGSGTSMALKSHVILKCSYTSPALQANPWHKTPLCTYRAAMLLFKSLKPLFHKIYKAALCSMGWEIIKVHIICSSLHFHGYSSPAILSQGCAL